jgi:hypothetical protein
MKCSSVISHANAEIISKVAVQMLQEQWVESSDVTTTHVADSVQCGMLAITGSSF